MTLPSDIASYLTGEEKVLKVARNVKCATRAIEIRRQRKNYDLNSIDLPKGLL